MKNRAEKRRTAQTQRASAADRQRAYRASAHDPRRRSRPLRVVTACVCIIITLIVSILPTFAASAGFKGEDTYIAGSNIQTAEIIGAVSKYDLPYQSTIVGNDPSFFGRPQTSETKVLGNSLIVNSKMTFNEYLFPQTDTDPPFELTIPMYNFYPDTQLEAEGIAGVCNKIKFVWEEYQGHNNPENVRMYYISLTNVEHLVYKGYYWNPGQGWYWTGQWISEGYRIIYPSGGTGETPWTAQDNGILYYDFLKANATFTTYAGTGATGNVSQSPFSRTWVSETTAEIQTNERVKATTKYTIKAWWQASNQPLSIRFYGQNVVIDNRRGHYYPMINEIPDISPSRPKLTYRVRYTYFFNDSIEADEEKWVVYTGETTREGAWGQSQDGIFEGAYMYPSPEQLFGTEVAKRVGGIIYDEYETTITWEATNKLQNNFTLNVTDYYYKGAERRANEVAGFFDAFRRNFDSIVDPKYSSFGTFLSEAVGGFLDTPLFGNFSIASIMLTVIGIGLVIAFLKMFAGG